MFKVIDKRNKNILQIYAVSNEDINLKFLYFDTMTKEWKWCLANWFEPYIENHFFQDEEYDHNTKIHELITVTDINTGKEKYKKLQTHYDWFDDR